MTTDLDRMKTFKEALEAEINDIDKTLIPLLREYLNNVRDIRMGLAREVKDILQSSQEISKLTKTTQDIRDFVSVLMLLKDYLTPDMVEKIRMVIK